MTEVESFSVYSDDEENNSEYQPNPETIAKLYQEMKDKKILTLDWKCLGRLTPAEYDEENKTNNQETDATDAENDSKDNSNFNDFDFDEDIDTSISKMNLNKKKQAPAPKKVDLDKVMSDIKKYQKIEKQTKLSTDDEKV